MIINSSLMEYCNYSGDGETGNGGIGCRRQRMHLNAGRVVIVVVIISIFQWFPLRLVVGVGDYSNNPNTSAFKVIMREEGGYNSSAKLPTTRPTFDLVDEPTRMCTQLLKLSNNSKEGHEPWRSSGGFIWKYSHRDVGDSATLELGDHLSRWYMARAIASAAGVTLQLDCTRSHLTEHVTDLTDWIPNYVEPSETIFDDADASLFSWKAACQSDVALRYPHKSPLSGNGLDHLISTIRSDLRNMTDALLSKIPWLKEDLDEAIIHLRADGTDIGKMNASNYGLVPFHVFTSLIPNATKTIGIVTAPYRQNWPGVGYGEAELSEAVSMAARDYIQHRFPDARVRVRNGDANETIAATYVRMAAAKWSFCGSSTFCLYPALATTGESNIMQTPPHARRPGWLDHVSEFFENVHYVEGEIIFSSEFRSWSTIEIVTRLQRNITTMKWSDLKTDRKSVV